MARALRLGRAFIVVIAGIVAGVSLYVGFIQAGVIANPFAPVLQGDLASAKSTRPGLRVLFVGNSMTYYFDVPQMVGKLAAGDPGARPVFAVSYTRPGWTMEEAAEDERLAALLRDVRWDTVVLQEQTARVESSVESRRVQTDPYVRELQRTIDERGAQTLLYMTWTRRSGSDLGAVLGLPAAPVARAWDEANWLRPDLPLRLADGHHPNLAGAYLAACVFYAALTGRNPSESSFMAELRPADARYLQRIASKVVR